MWIQQPFDEFLGYTYNRLSDGEVEVGLEVKDLYVNSAGVIHGGIISSLADVAMSNLVPADDNGVQQMVTVDLNVSFLRAARGQSLRAVAHLEKDGRTLVHALCKVYDEEGRQVASAKGVFCRI
ncbi:MAG: PaaI family thioesterase [Bhargavaea sp.]